jgi:phage-related protein
MTAKHLNLSTVVDKNKITSDKAFVVLFKVIVRDYQENVIDTLRFAKNSENVIFQGDVFQAANFDLKVEIEDQKEPSISITAQDTTKTLSTYIDLYDGLVKSDVTLFVVHEDSLDGPAEVEESFVVIDSSVQEYVVTMNLGVQSAVSSRFPNFRQFRNRCAWKYKGERCKYVGAMPTCDFTRDGANGCIAHGNEPNFGGFPGLNDLF